MVEKKATKKEAAVAKEPKTRRAYVKYVSDPVFIGLLLLVVLMAIMAVYFATSVNCPKTTPVTPVVNGTGGGATTGGTGECAPENTAGKLVVYVFSEFLCPYCSAAAGLNPTLEAQFKQRNADWTASVPEIKSQYSGRVAVVFKHFIVHGESAIIAAEAAECARDQCKFWEMHDKMFQNQGSLGVEDLKKYAKELGLDTAKFDACLDGGGKRPIVEADTALGRQWGVSGTPTFFVGGQNGTKVVGAVPFSDVQAAIEIELDPAKKAAEAQRKADEARAQQEAMRTKLNLTTGDNKPQIDFFVMSYCPYGNQAEEGIGPVYANLKSKALFVPHYIVSKSGTTYSSLHGVQEFNQDIREICVNKYLGIDAYFKFVLAMNKNCTSGNADTCWENVARNLGLDVDRIKTCQQAESSTLADKEIEVAKALGVSGSPTVYVEGVLYSGGRTPQAYQQALCQGFDTAPPECATALSNQGAAAQGGCG